MPIKKAIYWTIFWVSLSFILNIIIYYYWDIISPSSSLSNKDAALAYLTGYIIEESLSVDNLFVFLYIFTLFKLKSHAQRRVLNYGIVGVIIMRGIFIFIGISMITRFEWILYIFGALLIYTGYTMAFGKEKEIHPEKNIMLRMFKKIMPLKTEFYGEKFIVKENGKYFATPMMVILILVESTDLVFAIDSIPAIFAITTDPFIIFTSNLMAVLGLRSLYFVLESAQSSFSYVKYGVGIVLAYVGTKMILLYFGVHIDILTSLVVIISVLATSILFSILATRKKENSN